MRKRDEICLWPVYFDSKRTRAEGRRVPKGISKPSPTLEIIAEALENLKCSYTLVPEAAHPYFPWIKTGLVLVQKTVRKGKILKDVAKELSRLIV